MYHCKLVSFTETRDKIFPILHILSSLGSECVSVPMMIEFLY